MALRAVLVVLFSLGPGFGNWWWVPEKGREGFGSSAQLKGGCETRTCLWGGRGGGGVLGTGWKTQQHGSAPQKGGGRGLYRVVLGVPGHS